MQYGWFLIYYFVLGAFSLWYGTGFIRQPGIPASYLITSAASAKPPRLLLKVMRYALMFTVVSLIVSLFPFALVELLFSVVLLGLIFAAGRLFLMWESIRGILGEKRESLEQFFSKVGWMLAALGMVSLALWFRLLSGLN
jgi:hypothetical protein